MFKVGNQARGVGKRVKQCAYALEKIGRPATYVEISQHLDIQNTNVSKYCYRAVELGFMTMSADRPRLFTIVTDWEMLLDNRPEKYIPPRRIINSVWSLAT
jgi:hypothetical protein